MDPERFNSFNLVLAPFQPPTRVVLEVSLNRQKSTTSVLNIKNPSPVPVTVKIAKRPIPEKGVELSFSETTIEAKGSAELNICWSPKICVTWWDVLILIDNDRNKYEVSLIMRSKDPPKKYLKVRVPKTITVDGKEIPQPRKLLTFKRDYFPVRKLFQTRSKRPRRDSFLEKDELENLETCKEKASAKRLRKDSPEYSKPASRRIGSFKSFFKGGPWRRRESVLLTEGNSEEENFDRDCDRNSETSFKENNLRRGTISTLNYQDNLRTDINCNTIPAGKIQRDSLLDKDTSGDFAKISFDFLGEIKENLSPLICDLSSNVVDEEIGPKEEKEEVYILKWGQVLRKNNLKKKIDPEMKIIREEIVLEKKISLEKSDLEEKIYSEVKNNPGEKSGLEEGNDSEVKIVSKEEKFPILSKDSRPELQILSPKVPETARNLSENVPSVRKNFKKTSISLLSEMYKKRENQFLRNNFDSPKGNLGSPKANFDSPKSNLESPKSNFDSPKANLESSKYNFDSPQFEFYSPESNFDSLHLGFYSPKPNFEYSELNFYSPKANIDSSKLNFYSPKASLDSPQFDFYSPKNFDSPKLNNFYSPKLDFYSPELNFVSPKFSFYTPKSKSLNCFNITTDPFSAVTTKDPFLDSTDLSWIQFHEQEFKKWLNALMTPPEDFTETSSVDIGKIWQLVRNLDDVHPETKESISARYHTNTRLNTLRKAALKMFSSRELTEKIYGALKCIETKRLEIKKDKNPHLDIGLQKEIIHLFLSYNPLWLRIGLETVYNETIPLKSNNDLIGLTRFLLERFFSNPEIIKDHSHPTVVGMRLPTFRSAMNEFLLKTFLKVVCFLDHAKANKLIGDDPCLFRKKSLHKESRMILVTFSSLVLGGIGDIMKVLRISGFVVKHRQSFLEEFDYAVQDMGSDLRDGVRLCRVMELVTGKRDLTRMCSVPANSKVQRIHNVGIAFKALIDAGYVLRGEIDAKSIAEGSRRKTLSLLWQIVYKFQAPRYEHAARVLQNWWRRKMKTRGIIREREEVWRRDREVKTVKIQKWWRSIQERERRSEDVRVEVNKEERMKMVRDERVVQLRDEILKMRDEKARLRDEEAKLEDAAKPEDETSKLKDEEAKVEDNEAKSEDAAKLEDETSKLEDDIAKPEDETSKLQDEEVRPEDEASKLKDEEAKLKDDEAKPRDETIKLEDEEAKLEDETSKLEDQEAKLEDEEANQEDENTKLETEEIKLQDELKPDFQDGKLKLKDQDEKVEDQVHKQVKLRYQKPNFDDRISNLQKQNPNIDDQRSNSQDENLNLDYQKSNLQVKNLNFEVRKCNLQNETLNFEERKCNLQDKNLNFDDQKSQGENDEDLKERKETAVFFQKYWKARKLMMRHKDAFLRLKENYSFLEEKDRKWGRNARKKQDPRELECQEKSAILIQRTWRSVKLMRAEREDFLKLKSSVKIIEEAWIQVKREREFLKREDSAIIIQKFWRRFLVSRRIRGEFLEKRSATIVVQRRWRAVRLMREERENFLKTKNAVRIAEEIWIRKRNFERREILKKRESAIVVQRFWRGYGEMKKLRCDFKKKREAAVVIQRNWRAAILGREERRKFEKVRSAILKIQRFWRRILKERDDDCWSLYKQAMGDETLSTETLESRLLDTIDIFRASKDLGRLSMCLASLDLITRLSNKSCIIVCDVGLVDRIYETLLRSNRSLPWMDACLRATSTLINLTKFPPTKSFVEKEDYIETLSRFLVITVEKEVELFLHIATLIWLLLGNQHYAQAFLANPRAIWLLKSLEDKVGHNKKFGDSKDQEKLPSLKPDWGLNQMEPRLFNNVSHATNSIKNILRKYSS